ncbi:MAG: GLUG motif-containing protein, partial [Bacteroidales bacterium]|nr:GLUG motif-containing protein [Bacteroidales bacterium]
GSWADNAASAFDGGSGTEEDPYQIATAEQLAYLAVKANEGTLHTLGDYYILTNNIDLSAHQWVPIGRGTGNESQYFDGYFNGNKKTITGLYVDESTDGYLAGLFGLLTGQVTDLTIEDAYVKTAGENSSAGILAGSISNSGTKVTNCHVSGTVESDVFAGGLTGYASYTEFESCSAKAKVSATGKNIGGFIGEGFAASFTDCAAEGSVTGSWCCGGFAGVIWYNAKAEHCIADVNVTATDWNTGGFVGYTEQNTSISDCVALGNVSNPITSTTTKLGGFVGSMDNSISIQNCHAAGTVQGGNEEHPAGGFIGYANGTFMGCSFDKEKNPALNAAGEGSLDSGVTGEETAEVLANICEDYFGGHQYSTEWTVDTEATCTTSGSKSHHCERCGAKGNVTEIPALGHQWGEPVYTWSEDNTTCTATRTCENNDEHSQTATATVTSEPTKAPTCTEMGEMTYMATFTEEWAVEQTKTEGIPVTGHHYVNGYCTECGQRDPNYVDPISYYNIYVENVCDGVEITTSKNVVREGGSISLYVEKDTANYTFDNFKVYYKRSYYGTWDELKEGTQPGEYPINNIWTHIYIKAQGAEKKEDPTGIESIEGVKVYTKDGSLYVQTPQREQVIIVSMSGAVVMNEEQIGLKQYYGLQPGIYIVRVGQTTYKLRLH